MREFEIKLNSVSDVLSFVSLATSRSFPIYVAGRHHQVNGKSFMEMFSLNLRNSVTVSVECTDEEFDAFRREAEPFRIK